MWQPGRPLGSRGFASLASRRGCRYHPFLHVADDRARAPSWTQSGLSHSELACAVYGTQSPTNSELAAVRRAVLRMEQHGLVHKTVRHDLRHLCIRTISVRHELEAFLDGDYPAEYLSELLRAAPEDPLTRTALARLRLLEERERRFARATSRKASERERAGEDAREWQIEQSTKRREWGREQRRALAQRVLASADDDAV